MFLCTHVYVHVNLVCIILYVYFIIASLISFYYSNDTCFWFKISNSMKVKVKVIQSCPTLCDHMDCSPWNFPGQNTAVVAFSSSSVSSQPRDRTQVSRIAGRFLTGWATRETLQVAYKGIYKVRKLSALPSSPPLHCWRQTYEMTFCSRFGSSAFQTWYTVFMVDFYCWFS